MRLVHASASAIAVAIVLSTMLGAQGAQDTEAIRTVAGGGISAPGWKGIIDAGQGDVKITDGKFMAMGGGFHIITGPAATYYNPANVAKGDYTVQATFNEPKFQNLMTHPHPYGLFIGGNKMDDNSTATLLYCEAYGTGTFIVRGFGPAAFQMNGRSGEANDAVHKAAGIGQPVEQTVAMSVKGDQITCSINGTVVKTMAKGDVVGAGKLESLDGVYGIRAAHNVELMVMGFGKK